MDLKEWEAMSPEGQQRRYDERQIILGQPMTEEQVKRGHQAMAASLLKAEAEEQSKGKCPAGLIELRNALKRQIDEERDSSSQYREASAKLTHYGHGASAYHIKEIAEQELMHHYVLRQVVDIITQECGE